MSFQYPQATVGPVARGARVPKGRHSLFVIQDVSHISVAHYVNKANDERLVLELQKKEPDLS